MKCYIYASDLADALIGPFGNVVFAEAHIRFCAERGDADPGRVVTEQEAQALRPVGLEMTEEQDRRGM